MSKIVNIADKMNNKENEMNMVFAVVNRNNVALLLNGKSNKYSKFTGDSTTKASLRAISTLLNRVSDRDFETLTIIVPKNLACILRKDSVYEWVKNGNKTGKGTQLDDEFIELAKYISDMRNWFGSKVKVKMIDTPIITPEEHKYMKSAWNLLDKETGYRKTTTVANSKPELPSSLRK
jgi:hypothetical protein